MLELEIPEREVFNEATQCFFKLPKISLKLEHSLVSISKWEAKWKKPFFSNEPPTPEQVVDYIKCMTLTQNVPENNYAIVSHDAISMKKINDYINESQTATWFSELRKDEGKSKRNSKTITSELVYYWMIALQIPMECQKWHISRLFTLIEVCNTEGDNSKSKKMSKREVLEMQKRINDARRAKFNTPRV